jgi:AcrR family transcriptional regulator
MADVLRKPGRPKNPDLKSRREAEILTAAAALFADSGFANTSVQAIADRLKIGHGTIFSYFPTKEALFLAVVERGLADLTTAMDAVMAKDEAPLKLLREAICTYLQFFGERPEMAEMFIQERANFPHHHRPLYFSNKDERDCQKQDAFFRRLQEGGVLRPMPQDRFMAVVGDLLYGTIMTNLLSGRPVDPEAQAEAVFDVLGRGILSDAERKRQSKSNS